jgi:hypothetical protein
MEKDMKKSFHQRLLVFFFSVFLASCSTLEQASLHGLNSGYYIMKSADDPSGRVYLDVGDEKVDVYRVADRQPDKNRSMGIRLSESDSVLSRPVTFKKQSLDVDITSILMKYRPAVQGLPAQMHTDLNLAMYFGWRRDSYKVIGRVDPLGRRYHKIGGFGYDFGVFAGPGTTPIGPSTTGNQRSDEYSGIVFQTGMAGFVESDLASFGLSIGYDHLMGPDRKIWIYRNKPWVGFIVGIALK